MRIEAHDGILRVSGLRHLDGPRAELLQREVEAALPAFPQLVEFELAETTAVDCTGLGALVAIQEAARQRNPEVGCRLVRPAPPVRQLLRLTRLQHLFTVT